MKTPLAVHLVERRSPASSTMASARQRPAPGGSPRQLGVGVLEIREVRVDRARVPRTAAQVFHTTGRLLACPGDGRARLGSVMRRKHLSSAPGTRRSPHLRGLARNHCVLTVQRSGSARRTPYGRLLPEMQRRTRHHEAPVGPARPALIMVREGGCGVRDRGGRRGRSASCNVGEPMRPGRRNPNWPNPDNRRRNVVARGRMSSRSSKPSATSP